MRLRTRDPNGAVVMLDVPIDVPQGADLEFLQGMVRKFSRGELVTPDEHARARHIIVARGKRESEVG